MPRRTLKRFKPTQQDKKISQIQEVLRMIIEIDQEATGLREFIRYAEQILRVAYPNHAEARRELKICYKHTDRIRLELLTLRQTYKRYLDDHLHVYGTLPPYKKHSLSSFLISFEALLEHYPIDVVMEDFLNEQG